MGGRADRGGVLVLFDSRICRRTSCSTISPEVIASSVRKANTHEPNPGTAAVIQNPCTFTNPLLNAYWTNAPLAE
mgnify:CR=1 FL=1